MKSKLFLVLGLFVCVALSGVIADRVPADVAASSTLVETADVVAFQPAGDAGGGPLVAGTFFPPTKNGSTTLKRSDECLRYTTHTTGLPAGAYTNWWVVFNAPEECLAPGEVPGSQCGGSDLFNADAEPSVFWATGKVVQSNGVGNFNARHCVGDDLGFPGTQNIIPGGLTNPMGAVFWSIIKYHGPASSDPNVLYDQLHTLLGSCEVGANALVDPIFGLQCFDPQIAVFSP